MGVAGVVNVYRFNNGNPVSFGDPLGLMPCTREERKAGKETVASKGGLICVVQRDRDPMEGPALDAMQACRRESFFLGAGTVADFIAVGELYRGAKAVGSAVALLRTNIGLGARGYGVPGVILEANRGRIAVAATDLATQHATSSAAVGAPLGAASDRAASFSDAVKAIGKALAPFSTFNDQVARTASACNPE